MRILARLTSLTNSRVPIGIPPKRFLSSSSRLDASYGFIGLGRMGYPMARNLRKGIKPEDTVFVHDVVKENAQRLKEEVPGITVASDAREVAENSDTIITMLPEPQHVKSVFGDLFASPLTASDSSIQKLFIDCSTIDPTTSLQVGELVRKSYLKAEFVDAPVSGGVVGAEAATLTFMLGAPAELVDRINETLKHMGKRILLCGDQGSGIVAKLANNYLLAMENIATAEAMNFGTKLGLDPTVLKNVINVSTGKCWSSEINNPVDNSARDYVGGFGVSLMKKDLKLAIDAAKKADAKIVLGDHALEVYEAAAEDPKCTGRDFSVVYRWLGGSEKKQ